MKGIDIVMIKLNKNTIIYGIISVIILFIGILIGTVITNKGEDLDISEELRPIIKAFCDIESDMTSEEVKEILKKVNGDVEYKSFANIDAYKDEEFYAVNVEDERLRIDFKGGKIWIKGYTRNSSKTMWADTSKVYYKQYNENDVNNIKLFENKKTLMEDASEDTIEKFTKILFN